jgi:YVTN family beta-propeller protein
VLYVPHTSNYELDLVDTQTLKLVGTIERVPGIKGIALTPDPNVVFVSESASSSIGVVDTEARKVLETIPVNGTPDAIAYDALDDAVLATSSANQLTVVDRKTRKVKTAIDLPGSPELMTVDNASGVAYVAINDKNEVAAITIADSRMAIFRGCDLNAPTGVALDDNQHLFVAGHGSVSVIDVLVDKCLGTVDIGSGVDQLAINLHLHHLYTANGGSRNLSVIDTRTFQPLGIVGTGPSGDGVAADPNTDLVYVMIGRAGIVGVYHDP